jgi:dTMP kinase
MDMGYSSDPQESFRLFQEQIHTEYRRMAREYDFVRIDATESPEIQQTRVRQIVESAIDLPRFRWREAPYVGAAS